MQIAKTHLPIKLIQNLWKQRAITSTGLRTLGNSDATEFVYQWYRSRSDTNSFSDAIEKFP